MKNSKLSDQSITTSLRDTQINGQLTIT